MIRRKGNKKAWGLLLVMLALFCMWIPRKQATAADASTTSTQGGKLEIIEIDYEKETITIHSTKQDTRLYYSDAKQKNWECAYGSFGTITEITETGNTVTKTDMYVLDISWIKKTKDYVLTLKGDVSDTVVSVTLPKQQTNFKPTFDYITEAFKYVNRTDEKIPIYWRKNNSTRWELVDSAVMQRFYARGVTLYFRLGQVKGTSDTNVGSRPSKEVKLSIAKQASAPSVTITTATQVLTLPALLQYQIYVGGKLDGDASTWTTASSKKLSIPNDVAQKAYCTAIGANDAKEVKVVFRTAATAKKPASMEKTITIKAQETAPSNVIIEIASSKALNLKIPEITKGEGENAKVTTGASSSNPYEYTIVLPDQIQEWKLETATWKAITSTSAIILTKEKVPPASMIYVRKKAHVAADDKTVYYPESQYYSYKVGNYDRAESRVELALASSDYAYEETIEDKKVIRLVKEEEIEAKGLQFQIVVDMQGSNTEVSSDGNNSTTEIGGTELSEVKITSILCNSIELKFEDPDEADAAETGDATAKAGDDATKTENGTAKIKVRIIPNENFEKAAVGNTAYPLVITLSNGEVLQDKVTLTILKKAYLKQDYLLGIIKGAKYTDSDSENNPNKFVIVTTRKLAKSNTETYEWANVTDVKLKKTSLAFKSELNEADGTIEITLVQNGETASEGKATIDAVLGVLGNRELLEITVEGASGTSPTTIEKGVEVIYTTEATTVPGTEWQYTKRLNEELENSLEIKMSYKTPGVSISEVILVPEVSTPQVPQLKINITGNCYVNSEYVYAVLSKNEINGIKAENITVGRKYKVQVVFSNGAVVDTGCSFTFNN